MLRKIQISLAAIIILAMATPAFAQETFVQKVKCFFSTCSAQSIVNTATNNVKANVNSGASATSTVSTSNTVNVDLTPVVNQLEKVNQNSQALNQKFDALISKLGQPQAPPVVNVTVPTQPTPNVTVNLATTTVEINNPLETSTTTTNNMINTSSIKNQISASLGNFPIGGVIGLATATVDVAPALLIAQTTVNQTLTLPVPTVTTNETESIVINTGAASFVMYGITIGTNQLARFYYTSVLGWGPAQMQPQAQSIQTLNATGNVSAWGSTVLIGATPLVANITLTLPTVVGSTGSPINFIRLDNAAFTVSLQAFAGQTLTLTSGGVELNSQNGGLTVEAVDATNARQVSNIGTAPSVANFGQITSITNGQSTASTAFVDVTGSTFTLPVAGTYKITYSMAMSNSASGQGVNAIITDSLNNIVTGSGIGSTNITSASAYTTGSQTVTVTIAQATSYKIRWGVTGGTGTIVNTGTIGNAGNSTLSWQQIGGFTPVTGQTADYVNAVLSANQVISAIGNDVTNWTSSAGNIQITSGTSFALTAGKTYDLSVFLAGSSSASGFAYYQWVDATTNVAIGNATVGSTVSYTGHVDMNGTPSEIIYTPTSNQSVKVRLVSNISGSWTGYTPANALVSGFGSAQVTIRQLGSSAVLTSTAVNDQSGALSGYFDVGTMRMQWGVGTTGNLTTVPLPAPFLNATYRVQTTLSGANFGTANLLQNEVVAKTTTTFTTNTQQLNTGSATIVQASGQSFDWFAIGLHP